MNIFISELQKRSYIWDHNDLRYKDKALIDSEWEVISETTGYSKEDARRKWKNLRDQFRKEIKRVPNHRTYTNEQLIEIYSGKWLYFPVLMFLRETLVPSIIPNIKDEINYDESFVIKDDNNSYTEDSITQHDMHNQNCSGEFTITTTTSNNQIEKQSPTRNNSLINIKKKRRRITPTLPIRKDIESDSDWLFFRSLLPYFKQLSPIKQLRVRNKIQEILIEEISS